LTSGLAFRSTGRDHFLVTADSLEPGLYAELVTNRLAALLRSSTSEDQLVTALLRDADAAERLSRYIGSLVAEAVLSLDEGKRAVGGLEIVLSLLRQLEEHSPAGRIPDDQLAEPVRMLEAIRSVRPDGSYAPLELPLTPLLDTTVLTSARGEPTVQHELIAEIPSALSIDLLIAFVRWSGVRPMLAALRRHVEEGGRIRLLTTIYTNSTEARALDELAAIGAEVRVSYDTTTTRLHAKAWLFHRHRGTTTAYIGSSNLTHSAHVTGLEWNVRVSGLRNPDVVAKMAAVFESYWESGDFLPYDPVVFRETNAGHYWRPIRAAAHRASPEVVPGALARAGPARTASWPSQKSDRGCYRNWQDGDGGGGFRPTAIYSAAIAFALCGAPTGDAGAESRDLSIRAVGCELR
jgi:HKD family nuclease